MSAQSPIDFADPDAVRGLVPGSSDQRLVRLCCQDGTNLYSLPVTLALTSGVLRTVLEDAQEQNKEQYINIPLDDGADAAASWQAALAFMHHQKLDVVTMNNAQGLLLLAHKHGVSGIAGERRVRAACCRVPLN